jgi:NAD-reducing hydrogenase large subunit
MSALETAAHPQGLKRIEIEPITRVEGHGKITLLLDEDNHIQQARLHIVEFRGFEKFIQGRPYWEIPVLVQRLCGICPVSHHLAAAKAVDMIAGLNPEDLPPTVDNLRRLLHYGQTLQSHALHFYHLSSPDLLFGFDDDVAHRNIIGVIQDHPDIALQGVRLRKYGQEVIRVISGKRVHGTACIPGGMNKGISRQERSLLLSDIDQIIQWSQNAVALSKKVYLDNSDFHNQFAYLRSNMLGLIRQDGAFDIYHGGLRARDDQGNTIFDHVDYRDYHTYIHEEIKSWSYMKFPFIVSKGREEGWYRVGPLARINNCDFITTPLAEQARQEFKQHAGGGFVHGSLAYHWARMIEMLFCAEAIKELLHDPATLLDDLLTPTTKQLEGIGVVEAPRGTLFHHYRIKEDDTIEMANLIVSTTSNNQAMNESIRQVAATYLDGRELTEGLLNHLEVTVRAYDPCLSCATHALGKMPLQVELLDSQGQQIDCLSKSSSGVLSRD